MFLVYGRPETIFGRILGGDAHDDGGGRSRPQDSDLSPVYVGAVMPRKLRSRKPAGQHGFMPKDRRASSSNWARSYGATRARTLVDKAFCPDDSPVRRTDGFVRATVPGTAFAGACAGGGCLRRGRRAFDLTVARIPQKSSVANMRARWHYHLSPTSRCRYRFIDAAKRSCVQHDRLAQGVHTKMADSHLGPAHRINLRMTWSQSVGHLGGAVRSSETAEQIFSAVSMGTFHPGNPLAHEG